MTARKATGWIILSCSMLGGCYGYGEVGDELSAAVPGRARQSSTASLRVVEVGEPLLVSLPRVARSGTPMIELPPVVIRGGWRQYLVAAFESYSCAAPWGIFAPDPARPARCVQVLAPVVDNSVLQRPFSAVDVEGIADWRRNYNGVFSAHLIDPASDGNKFLVAISHNENKGELRPFAGPGEGTFLNSFLPEMENHVDKAPNAPCMAGHGCYFGGVSLSKIPWNKETNWGQQRFWQGGPFLWPSAGYGSSDGRTKLSNGPRHPSSIVKDGRIYTFYIDHTWDPGSSAWRDDMGDRRSGLKVARSDSLQHISPHHWKVYYNGAFREKSIPDGLTRHNVRDYLATPGPRATPLFGGPEHRASKETSRFSVAKIRGTSFYLGIETYVDWQNEGPSRCPGQWKLALRVSRDLVNWSDRRDIYGCLRRKSFLLHYALPLDKESWTNYEVDADSFYILGTGTKLESMATGFPLYAIRVSIEVG